MMTRDVGADAAADTESDADEDAGADADADAVRNTGAAIPLMQTQTRTRTHGQQEKCEPRSRGSLSAHSRVPTSQSDTESVASPTAVLKTGPGRRGSATSLSRGSPGEG